MATMYPDYLSLFFFPVDAWMACRKYPPVTMAACPSLACLHSATLPLASPAIEKAHI